MSSIAAQVPIRIAPATNPNPGKARPEIESRHAATDANMYAGNSSTSSLQYANGDTSTMAMSHKPNTSPSETESFAALEVTQSNTATTPMSRIKVTAITAIHGGAPPLARLAPHAKTLGSRAILFFEIWT